MVFLNFRVSAQYPTDSAKIFLISLTPGTETYAAFGHSAIRVLDVPHHVDLVYNWGTFDFDTPHFYEKFIFGRLLYSLSVDRFDDFMAEYMRTGQGIYMQKIKLTNTEKSKFIQLLQNNYKPEYRYYRYDFLFDDCSTRIRDLIENAVESKITYDEAYIKKHVTFRRLLVHYLHSDPWMKLGFEILLGPSADKVATTHEYMFLPEPLMNLLSHAERPVDGKKMRLSVPPMLIIPSSIGETEHALVSSPVFIFSLLLLLILAFSIFGHIKQRYSMGLDLLLFCITGLLGILFLVLWVGSMHQVLRYNFNIIWANPLNIGILAGLLMRRKSKWFKNLLLIVGILMIIFVPVSFLLTQHFPLIAYMMDVILLVRTVRIYRSHYTQEASLSGKILSGDVNLKV